MILILIHLNSSNKLSLTLSLTLYLLGTLKMISQHSKESHIYILIQKKTLSDLPQRSASVRAILTKENNCSKLFRKHIPGRLLEQFKVFALIF